MSNNNLNIVLFPASLCPTIAFLVLGCIILWNTSSIILLLYLSLSDHIWTFFYILEWTEKTNTNKFCLCRRSWCFKYGIIRYDCKRMAWLILTFDFLQTYLYQYLQVVRRKRIMERFRNKYAKKWHILFQALLYNSIY